MKKLNLLAAVLLLLFCIGCTQQKDKTEQTDEPDVLVFPQLGHGSQVLSVAISPDGKRIVSGSYDKTLKLWDVETGREIRTLRGHIDPVNSVAFSPNGKYILSGSGINDDSSWSSDNTLKLWDVETGKEIRTFSGHTDSVNSVAFSPDGKKIISGSSDRTTRLWDTETGEEIMKSDSYGQVETVAFSHDGSQFLSCVPRFFYQESFVSLLMQCDAETDKGMASIINHAEATVAVFSPEGDYLLSGCSDNALLLLKEGEALKAFYEPAEDEERNGITSAAYSSDGSCIISGYRDNSIRLWDAETTQKIKTFSGHTASVTSVVFSPDGKTIISGSDDSTIKIWDIDTGKELRTLDGITNQVYSAAVSPDGKYLISCSADKTLKLWDITTGNMIRTFEGHSGEVNSVCFSPNGKQILSGATDQTLILWDINTGQEIRSFIGHNDWVQNVTISHDGKYVLSGSSDFTMKIWDITTENGSMGGVGLTISKAVGENSDGRPNYVEVVSPIKDSPGWHAGIISEDLIIEIDGVTTNNLSMGEVLSMLGGKPGREVQLLIRRGENTEFSVTLIREPIYFTGIGTFNGHIGEVESVSFMPNEEQVLSSSVDGTTRIWDISTEKEIASFISFSDGEWIVITPDGYYNTSPNGDRHLNVRIGSEVFGVGRFAATFYQPEIVQARLQGIKDPPLVKSGGTSLKTAVPPKVDIAVINQDTFDDTVDLAVVISDQLKPIRKMEIEITVNGHPLRENELQTTIASNGITSRGTHLLASSRDNRLAFIIPITLDPGINYIEVIAGSDLSYGVKRIAFNNKAAKAIQENEEN